MRVVLLSLVVALVPVSLAACDKAPKKSEASTAAAPSGAPVAPTPGTAPAAAPQGQTFGAGVKLATSTPIDAILAEPKKFAGQTVRVEGMVLDVCPKRGCWMELAGDKPGQKLKFKVTDGEMTFPMDAKGKKAAAEGVISVRDLTPEQSKAYAEYQAKEYGKPVDPANVPTSIVQLDGTGAMFLN
jgi:hypothetical protein